MNQSMEKSIKKIDRSFFTVLLIVVFWLGEFSVTQTISTNSAYIAFGSYLLIRLVLYPKIKLQNKQIIILSLCPFGLWIYGAIVGILAENNLAYILRNFAGLVLYFFLVLIYDLDIRDKINRLLLNLSVLSGALTIIGYYLAIKMNLSFMYTTPILNNFQPGYGVLYGNCNFMYISYLYGLYKVLIEKKLKLKYLIMIVICPYASFVCMEVSAFPLACIVFFGGMLMLSIQKQKFNKSIRTTLILIVLVACVALPMIYGNYIAVEADDGNVKRWAQIEYVFKNFKILGHGLGAEYPKGIGSSYAIEVIFLDIFYKFGIFALFLIYGYFYTLLKAVKYILVSRKDAFSTIPLACMGYLFFALSNPVLFAPNSVLLHCCSIYLLLKADTKKELGMKLLQSEEVMYK